jgi:hypothetical protein
VNSAAYAPDIPLNEFFFFFASLSSVNENDTMIPLTRTLYEQNIILMIFYTIQQHHRILQSDTLPMPPDIERRRIGCRQASLADIRTRTETASLFFSVIKRLR